MRLSRPERSLWPLLRQFTILPKRNTNDESLTWASFKGSYGASCEGTIVGVGPLTVIGALTANGNGNISGVETLSVNGVITSGVTLTGTYTVDADCTGSIVTTTPDGAVTDHDFVLDDNKKEIRIIVIEPGVVVVCTGRKQ